MATELGLKAKILNFVKSRNGGVSFVEICREVPGCEGRQEFGWLTQNIILWQGVSEEFCTAMQELWAAEEIALWETSLLTYLCDGQVPLLPQPRRLNHSYKSPRWLPVAVYLPHQIAGRKVRRLKAADVP